MAARIAFLGTNGGVSFSGRGFDQALEEIGHNTGNAMFQYALWDMLRNPKMTIRPKMDVAAIRDNADVLLIPAANQVHPDWDLTGWADLVEGCDMPTVVIGLGAQAWIGESSQMTMKTGTMRFLKAASERTSNIGVRGEFTQDVLSNLGIRNTVVTGCPSRTINRNLKGADIAAKLETVKGRRDIKLGYLYGTFEEGARKAEARLSSIAQGFDHDIITQTDAKIMRAMFDGKEIDRNYLSWFGSIARPGILADDYIRYLRKRGIFFSDARTWVDRMAYYDLVIGMRIHGAIAAIMGGTAGVCVAFDSRTLELAQTMGVPYVLHTEIENSWSMDDILAQVKFDPDRFDTLQRTCIAEIESILITAGCAI
jgi:hypothetical protein